MQIETNGIELGERVRDELTNYEGIVVGWSQSLGDTDAVALVQAPVDKDGKVPYIRAAQVNHLTKLGPSAISERVLAGANAKRR